MYQRKDGDSSFQREIEQKIFHELRVLLCADDLKSNISIPLPHNPEIQIKPDFYSESKKIIGEIHVHLGRLKPAQKHKVAADILKLHLFDPNNQYRKYYIVSDAVEYDQLMGNSFIAEAIRQYEIIVKCMPLDQETIAQLQQIMNKQNMFQELTFDELKTVYEFTFGAPPPLMLLLGMNEDKMKEEIRKAIDSGKEIHVDLEPGAVI